MSKPPTKTALHIAQELANKRFEKPLVLSDIEDLLVKQRGYIYKQPAPGTPVVVSLSGGADSTIVMAMLLEEFDLEVYPYFMQRSQSNITEERKSVDFFMDYFKKRYPGQVRDLAVMNVPNPANEIKKNLTPEIQGNVGHPLRNAIITGYGVQYAYGLAAQGLHIRNIFCSFVPSDANHLHHSTLTAVRALTFQICVDMGDFDWQICALPIEKELGYYFDKDVLVRWATEKNLPLEKTRTCYGGEPLHCGICAACYDRKRGFEEAGIKDKTQYTNTLDSKQVATLLASKHH